MNYVSLIIVALVVVGLLAFARRARARQQLQQNQQRERIGFGTEVMTTSGLYGTVVGINQDDTVQLSIAPGVEVKWAMAALRDAATLPERYQPGLGVGPADEPEGPSAPRPPVESGRDDPDPPPAGPPTDR
ncbi:MAG: preprotein translocase subunit YajC [Actinobacteria bacterium]|nr:preprotein translocase subunit YajC [Actinomycetota bacterium]